MLTYFKTRNRHNLKIKKESKLKLLIKFFFKTKIKTRLQFFLMEPKVNLNQFLKKFKNQNHGFHLKPRKSTMVAYSNVGQL